MHIIHSETKYAGDFVVEDHNTGEVLSFVGEYTERRELTPVLIQ